ncbi:ComEC/Rec2 family competence protein [Arthrobacter sp. H5]|uniref:ComEC/Rec2 family competence protein n=1 Tax=Arthrobacter sp. H5 TaxID=1267973 RepID=UPI001C1E0FBA|nr:ComEC/Rec2 family competence protein [Arthrobacter sp. H5]
MLSRPARAFSWTAGGLSSVSKRIQLSSGARQYPEPPRITDLRLVPAAAAAWIAAALVTRVDAGAALWAGILLAVLAAGWGGVLVLAKRLRRTAVLVVVCSAVGAMVCLPASGTLAAQTAGPVADAISSGAHITAVLVATGDAGEAAPSKFGGETRWVLDARLVEGTGKGVRFEAGTPVVVIGPGAWSAVKIGDHINSAGKLVATGPGERADALFIASTRPRITATEGAAASLTGLRMKFLGVAAAVGTPDDGLMPGMVIGDETPLDKSLQEKMRITGLTHLTAVSGANCTYVLAFVFIAARTLRLPRAVAAGAGIVALVGFVLLVRPEPSVLRAAVMGSIGVLAILTGRGRLSLTLLLLSITVLLTTDPWLHGEFGFILSVTATAALVLFGPWLAYRLSRWMPQRIAQLIAVPVAAQVFCSPVLVLLQPELPLYSVPANIAAAPVVPFVTILGMAAVLLVGLFAPLSAPFALAAGWGAAWVAWIARFFADAPAASIPWQGGIMGAVLTSLLSLAVVAGVVWAPKLAKVFTMVLRGSRLPSLAWISSGCVLGLAASLLLAPLVAPPQQSWVAAACDVGQGDGFVVQTAAGEAMVIDTGADPDGMDICLDRLAVTTVPLLVITHQHLDHYGGTEGVFRDRTVGQLLYSSTEPALPPEVGEPAREHGIEPLRLTAGAEGSIGAVSWTSLWPPPDTRALSENDASAVLKVDVRVKDNRTVSILFTGDIEEQSAADLLRTNPQLSVAGVDILKVSHHGARNGGLGIIESTDPSLAMISVGHDNDYGHPHADIVGSLDANGVPTVRTDLLGTFTISLEGNALEVRSLG